MEWAPSGAPRRHRVDAERVHALDKERLLLSADRIAIEKRQLANVVDGPQIARIETDRRERVTVVRGAERQRAQLPHAGELVIARAFGGPAFRGSQESARRAKVPAEEVLRRDHAEHAPDHVPGTARKHCPRVLSRDGIAPWRSHAQTATSRVSGTERAPKSRIPSQRRVAYAEPKRRASARAAAANR